MEDSSTEQYSKDQLLILEAGGEAHKTLKKSSFGRNSGASRESLSFSSRQ